MNCTHAGRGQEEPRSRREARHGHGHSSEGSSAGDHRGHRRHLHRCSRTSHLGHKPLPSREAIIEILCDLLDILYPGYWRRQNLHIGNVEYHVGDLIDGLHDKLTQQIARALRHEHDLHAARGPQPIDLEALAQQKTVELLKRLPDMRA